MSRCVIFVFSATGNTAYVASCIKEFLEEKDVQTTIYNIETIKDIPDISNYDYLGLGYPVHAFSLPLMVEKFAWKIPVALPEQKAFVFATCAGGYFKAVEKGVTIMGTRVYKIIRSRAFTMPGNFLLSYNLKSKRTSDKEREKLFEEARKEAGEYVNEILEGKTDVDIQGGVFWDFTTAIVSFAFRKYGANWIGSKFSVNESCTGCKLCARTCPAQNIAMQNKRPEFLNHCIACCRCYNVCPEKAIVHKNVSDHEYRYTAPGYKPPTVIEV